MPELLPPDPYAVPISRLAELAQSRRTLARASVAALASAALLMRTTRAARAAHDEGTPEVEVCVETTPEENVALVQEYWDTVWTAGGDANSAKVLAEDEVHHWGTGGPTTGVDAFNERLRFFLAAFPDFKITVEDTIADGDMVVSRYSATGTHEGVWQGVEPTGIKVEYTGMNIFRIECGMIAESWGEANHVSLLRQIGAIPGGAPATPTS